MEKQEFNLSEKGNVLLDFDSYIPIKQFDKNGEGFGIFYFKEDIKEFIRLLKDVMVLKDCKECFIKEIDKLAGS